MPDEIDQHWASVQRKLPIMEKFDSIQGEGIHIGRFVTFIRIAGCNLRCPWCDTAQSWTTLAQEEEMERSILSLLSDCQPMVVITGGEPLLREETFILIRELQLRGHYVAVETNGTLSTVHKVDGHLIQPDWVTCSPKPPMYSLHPDCRFNELKFVMDDELNWNTHIRPITEVRARVPVWIQPNGECIQESAEKAYQMVQDHPGESYLRVGIQLHKMLNFR